jgi:PIN domain nuclease of toxin-antitoxin system
MNVLLDTCTFLWVLSDAPDLSPRARELYMDPANGVFLSSISVWEIVLKNQIGKLPLPQPPELFIAPYRQRHGIQTLSFDEPSAITMARLPLLHRDPFDRALVAQAITHDLVLLTPDADVRAYSARSDW